MKVLLEDIKLQRDYKLPSGNWEHKFNKIKCELKHGHRIRWYYNDDVKFAKEIGEDPRQIAPYGGIIISLPDVELRSGGEIDIEDSIVIIDNYPTEKCYPICEWVVLTRLLDSEDLVEIFLEKV